MRPTAHREHVAARVWGRLLVRKAAPAAARQADATESSRGAACTSSRADRDEGRGWRLLRDMGCDCGLDFFKLKLTSCASCRACPGVAAIGVRVQTGSGRRGPVTGLGTATATHGADRQRRDTRRPGRTAHGPVIATITCIYETHTRPPTPARHAPRSTHVRGPAVAPRLCKTRVQYRGSDRISLDSRLSTHLPGTGWPHSFGTSSSIALRHQALSPLRPPHVHFIASSYGIDIDHCISSHCIASYAISSSGISNGITAAAIRCLLVRR